MNLNYSKNKIEFKKDLNNLDKFVIDFVSILNKLNLKYVIISGYVAILFGRSRSSEDIDMIIEKINFVDFSKLWNKLNEKLECINAETPKIAYEEYLMTNHAIRFSRKKEFIPNMEIKFPKLELEEWVLIQRKKILLNENELYISPIELQIPFKLFLGSEKDVEDAKYLYKIFKDKIDLRILEEFNRKLKVEELFNRYLK